MNKPKDIKTITIKIICSLLVLGSVFFALINCFNCTENVFRNYERNVKQSIIDRHETLSLSNSNLIGDSAIKKQNIYLSDQKNIIVKKQDKIIYSKVLF